MIQSSGTGTYVTNRFDLVGRVRETALKTTDWNVILNTHIYEYNLAGQRTRQTRTSGEYVDYTYDNIGQLATASAYESDAATTRDH